MKTRLTKQTVLDFLNAGMSREILQEHHDTIQAENAHVLRAVSLLSLGYGIVMLLVSYTNPMFGGQLPFHLMWVLSSLVIAVFTPTHRTNYKDTALWSLAYVVDSYVFAALNSIVACPDQQSALVVLSLAVMPILFTGLFWKCALPGLVFWHIYVVLAWIYCAPGIRVINILYSFMSLSVGLVVSWLSVRRRSAQLRRRDQLLGQRDTDPLTKTVSRRSGEERIRTILSTTDVPCAMIMVDIDNFKGINDTFGHGYGDLVLETVAGLLRGSFRSTDVVCRLGGDEFMIFVVGVPENGWITAKAQDVLDALAATAPPQNKPAKLSLSMGIVESPRYGTEFEELYRKADHALYQAKRAGKNRYHLFGVEP